MKTKGKEREKERMRQDRLSKYARRKSRVRRSPTRTMDSRDRDFPRQGNELTSCQTSPSRKGSGVVESRWRGDGRGIFDRLPREPSLPEQDVSSSSANCATEIGNYARRDRFDIENWKRFKWQSGNLECHGEMRPRREQNGPTLLITSRVPP